GRAAASAKQERYQEALADLSDILHRRPDIADGHYWRGIVHLRTGKLDFAVADLTAALRLNPKHVEALYSRGMAYRERALMQAALDDFQAARKLNPDNVSIRLAEADISFQNGDLARALAEC